MRTLVMTEWTKQAGAVLLGRKTYEMFAASWPKSTDPADEIATALNTRPKFVASRTLGRVDWNNSHLLKGDVAEEVAKLKAQEGAEIQANGCCPACLRTRGRLKYGEVEVGQDTVLFDSATPER